MVNKKPVEQGKAKGGGSATPTPSDDLVEDGKRIAKAMAKVAIPTRGKFSDEYILQLESKRVELQNAADAFIAGLEKYQWIIKAVLEGKAERERLIAIDPERLTNPVERTLAFANMARAAKKIMGALHRENPNLVKIAMEEVHNDEPI